ncbi:hypothetical protein ABBQ38_002014 [Trebouxia sp. C0009 RCD-2024]
MATFQARKEANSKGQMYTVKTGFNNIFPADEPLSAKILQAVDLLTPILTEGSLLANLHVLRCAEQGGNIPLVNQTFYNNCYAAVTHSTGSGAQQFKSADHPALAESYTLYRDSLPAGHAKPERPTFLKDVSIT